MKTRSRWSRLTAMVLAIAMIFTSQPVSAAEIILGFGTESGNTNINKEEHMTETTEPGTGETADEPETELETEIGTPTPAELAGIGTDGPAIINLNGEQDGDHKTYDLSKYPKWFVKWDAATKTGSRVTITSDGGTEEQFLPAGEIIDPSEYPEFRVKNGYATTVDVYWRVPNDSEFSPVANGTEFTYKLPEGITFSVGQEFPLIDENRNRIGTVTVGENGLVTVKVELPENTEPLDNFYAHFSLYGEMKLTDKKKEEKVPLEFPGLGTRNVTVDEDLTTNHLGFIVGKGLVDYAHKQYGWGYDGNLESAVHYNEDSGLIDEIWYAIRVTAESTNDGLLQYLEFDDAITDAKGGGEGDLRQYFHIDPKKMQIVSLNRKGNPNGIMWGSLTNLLPIVTEDGGDNDYKAHFAFDLSKLQDGLGAKGLEAGDYVIIVYPVRVDPEFWAKIGTPGGSTSESLVELSGYYSADNEVTVKNNVGDENSAKANWSMQKEWLNKKGTVTMHDGKPYVHYEIYVYPTVSETLANWLLEDEMKGGKTYSYRDNVVHIELYDQGNKRMAETTVVPDMERNGYWKYPVPKEIGGRTLERGDYLLISYDVLYDETVSKEDERLRNSIKMTINGIGPDPVGIESSYYSLDKRCLSKAEDVAKTAVAWYNSPLSWETVIGSIKNTSSGGEPTSAPMITKDSVFDDVLACEGSLVSHYFTQSDIDNIVLKDGTGATVDNRDGTKYKVTSMKGTNYKDLKECEANNGNQFSSRECNAFRIKFLADIPAPVTVQYTSQGYVRGSVQSIVYTNTSYFTPHEPGSTMSDTATLAYNDLDYLLKFPHGVDMENGLAKWYFLLNRKNNLEFGFEEGKKYQIEDILHDVPEDQEFYAAFAVPYRNGGIALSKGYTPDDKEWEAYRVPDNCIERTTVTEKETVNGEEKEVAKPAVLIDVTEYLRKKQAGEYNGCLLGFQPGDTIAIYVVTKIKKDTLFANGLHTLGNKAHFMVNGTSVTYTATSQNFTSKALDKTFGDVDQETRQLTYTVTVNEQGTKLTDDPENKPVTVTDTLEDGLEFAYPDEPEKVKVEVFHENRWKDLETELHMRDSVTVNITGKTLTVTYHDRGLPIRFTYDTMVVGEPGSVHVRNDVDVHVGTEDLIQGSSDTNVAVVGGTAGAGGDTKFQIRKVSDDAANKPLANATVELSRYELQDGVWKWQDFATKVSTADGSIWNDYGFVKDVLYRLKETTAPSGYGKAEDIYFIVKGTVIDSLDKNVRELIEDEKITVVVADPKEGIVIKDPPNKLTVTKVVTGKTAPTDGKTYSVTVKGPDGMSFTADQFSGLLKGTVVTCSGNTATFSVENGSRVVISAIPTGTYTVEEQTGTGQTYTATYKVNDVDTESGEVKLEDASGSGDAVTGTVEITNTYPDTGSLSVKKEALAGGYAGKADESTSYKFTVRAPEDVDLGNSDAALEIDETTASFETKSGNIVTFKLKANQTAVLKNLPLGTYTVTENVDGDGWTVTYAVTSGKAADGKSDTVVLGTGEGQSATGSVSVTNTYPDNGELEIVKHTSGSWAPAEGTYDVTITGSGMKSAEVFFGDVNETKDSSKVTVAEGSIMLHMPKETSVKVKGLTPGSYTVKESGTGFNAAYSVDSGAYGMDAPTIELENNAPAKVEIMNTYPNVGELTVTKQTAGGTAPEEGSYTVTVTRTDVPVGEATMEEQGSVTVEGMTADTSAVVSDNSVTFSVDKDSTATVKGLPAGTYEVTEEGQEGFVMTYTVGEGGATGPAVLGGSVESQAVTVTNTYPDKITLGIEGTKGLLGRAIAEGDNFTFEISEAGDDSPKAEMPTEKTATAAVDGTFTFGDVTFGATGTYNFTVHEVAGSDENIIYDDASYNVAVKVDYNVDGNSYYVSGVTVTDAEGEVLKTYDAEGYAAEGKVTLPTGMEGYTFVNEAKKGSLSIHKTNVDGAQTDEFTFSVKINDTLYEGEAKVNGVPVQVTGGQIILKGGDTAVIEGILCGSRYEVTETADEAYETTAPENAEGTIGADTPDVTVSYTNTYTTNDVTFQPSVTKVLTGREPIADEAYTFVEKIEKIDTEGSRTTLAEGIERTITLRQAKEAVFDEDTYTKADRGCTYIYTISEAAPAEDEKGITYDRTVYTVEVAIVDDGEGNLTAEVVSDPAGRDVAVTEETADDGTIRVSAAMTFTNTYTASGSAEIGTTKTLNGHTLSAGEFTFELWAADAEGSVTGTAALQTVKNGAGADPGAVKFAPVEYTLEDVGTHHYVITEQAPEEDADGITYDREPVHVIIEVTDNSDGTLNTEVTLDGEHTAFVNTYTASGSAEIAATKTLTGRALSAGEFTFELWAADADGSVTGMAALQTVKNGAGADPGAVRFAPVEYTLEDVGTHHYVIREQAPAEDAGGIAYDREPVQVTVEVTDNGDGTLGTAVTLDGEHTAFTNTYTADGTFKMNGSKTLTGSRAAAIGADEFRFLVEEVTTAADGTETRTQAATGTTLAGGMIDFTEIAYTLEDVGTHTYVVSETVPAEADRDPSITYSTQTFTVTVTVADGGQGNLTVTPAYPEGGVAFVNDYTANGTFTINNVQKTLTGAALAAGQFSFQLRDAAGTVLQTKTNAADGSVAFDPIAYTQADIGKDFVYTVAEVNAGAAGITYDAAAYTVTVHVADAGNGALNVTAQTTRDGQPAATAAFANAFAGSVTLTKTSTNGNLLPGAAFQLYARGADGWYIYNATYADGTYTTGLDGTLTVAGLPANDYYFIETQAPAGHVITTNADGTPVQYPFTIAPEGSGVAGAQVNAALAVTNQPQPVDTTLVVTKQLTYLEDLWTAVDDTFYVALYADEALTQRVSEIQPIRFQNQSASSTEFTGLEPGRTYYVGEVNAEGVVLNSVGGVTPDEAMFMPVFTNGNTAAITAGAGTQSVFFQNAFQTLPQEYYREGQLTITKQLLGADGTAKAGNGTFYAGIFADEAYTTLAEGVSSNIVALNLNGRDTASDTVSVTIAPDTTVTLYVTETDAEGHPVEGAASFAYDVTVEGAVVTMTQEDNERTVVITNQEREEIETETELQTEENQEDEILSQGSETHESGDEALEGPAVKAGTGSVKTGDETPLGLYIGLMAAAAVLLLALFLMRRRKRSE